MMTTFETKAVDFVVISLDGSRLQLVGFEICLIDLGAVKLKLVAHAINLELFKL
jgi:hypothetical protein